MWSKYATVQEHKCNYPNFISILFHGGFWEKARIWTCKECDKHWKPKKLVLTGDYTWVEKELE